jgi:hypothetical protein
LAYIYCAVGILLLIRFLDLRVKVLSLYGMGVGSFFHISAALLIGVSATVDELFQGPIIH